VRSLRFGWTRRITRDVIIITRDTERKKKRVCLHVMLSSLASRTSSSATKKKTDGEDDDDDVDANAKATKSAEDEEEEDNDEKKTKSNNNDKMSSLAEFLTTFSKLLETREGIDKTLKTVKYASVLSALVLTTNTDKTVEIFSLASDPKTRERTAQKLRKLAKSLSLSRGSLRLGKFLKFSLQCREHLALDAAREEEEEEKDNDDDDGSRFRLSSSKRQRRALEFLALFAEATYYFLEQGVWLQNVGVFRSEDAAKRKELKVLAMKVEFFMYATSIPLRVVEWRDLDGRERAAREKKNEAAAYERSMSTSKRLLSFISSPQKRGDEVGDRMEDTKSDGEFALAKANAVKSIVKDGLDLVLVTSDLEWIRERRARDFVANEWVYSTLSLSSALISISKLWVKAMRA